MASARPWPTRHERRERSSATPVAISRAAISSARRTLATESAAAGSEAMVRGNQCPGSVEGSMTHVCSRDDERDALATEWAVLGCVALDHDVVAGEKGHAEIDTATGAVDEE